MFLLTFETTGPVGACALTDLETGETRTEETREPKAHLKMLLSLTETLYQKAGVKPADTAVVAASCGPGSYTGIRIGVSSARAVAQALGIPCISVPTLAMFRACTEEAPAAVILNARRGQVYGAVYDRGGAEILPPGAYMLPDVTKAVRDAGLADETIFYGDGIDAYATKDPWRAELTGFRFAEPSVRYQTAVLAAAYAREAWARGAFCTPDELLPEYLRKAEAEQKLEDGTLARLREEKMKRFMSR